MDSYQNPQLQADLDALRVRLQQIDQDFRTLTEQTAGLKAELAKTGSGGGRTTEGAVAPLTKEAELVHAQVVDYETLNALIRQRIKLETEAATVVRNTAAAASRSPLAGTTKPGGGTTMEGLVGVTPKAAVAVGAGGAAAAETKQVTASIAAQDAQLARATERWIYYDDTIAKSGGLSASALQGLANGTITMRELGSQAATVAAKFGGWTAAAAGIYGVLGALVEVKDGAVQAQSAVQGLTRFVPNENRGQALQQITHEAVATNTPINEVGQTAQQFAKAFHNQSDVFTATHVALKATRLDTISLADSYKYLTAIVQETGGSVSQLPGIFDQLTAAQDRVGARLSVMLPAFAQSVGAVQQAGGDTSQLIAIESIAAKRTGFEGSRLGTMFRQGAGRYFFTAQARSLRESAGINPDLGYTQAFLEALQKAPGWNGVQRANAAAGFFGLRFGPSAAPIFRAKPADVQYALTNTSAAVSQGLSEQQLAKFMGQADQQVTSLKIHLQALGAELAGSDIAAPFKILVHVLNEALDLVGQFAHTWDSLPSFVRQGGADAAGVLGLVAVARRYNAGGVGGGAFGAIAGGSALGPFGALAGGYLGSRFLSPAFSQRASVAAANSAKAIESKLTDYYKGERISSYGQLSTGLAEQKIATTAEGRAAANAKATAAAQRIAAIDSELASIDAQGIAGLRARNAAFAESAGFGALGLTGGAAGAAKAGTFLEGGAAKLDILGLGTMAERANSALSRMASTIMSYGIPAFIAFSFLLENFKTGQKETKQGFQDIANAQNDTQAERGYHLVRSGGHTFDFLGVRVPEHPLTTLFNWFSGTTEKARDDANAKETMLHGLQSALPLDESFVNKILALQKQGKYGEAYKLVKGDPTFKAWTDTYGGLPDIRGTGHDYYQLTNQLAGQKAAGGKQDPFFQWQAFGKDIKNQLEPYIQSYANAAKVFGSGDGGSKDLDQVIAGYAYAVHKFGNDPHNTNAMQALASAQEQVKAVLDQQVQDLTSAAQAASTPGKLLGDLHQALGDIHRVQDKARTLFKEAAKLPDGSASKKDMEAAAKQLQQQADLRRPQVIQQLLSFQQTQTQLQAASIIGVGPSFDLRRSQVTLAGLQSQLSQAKKEGADVSTIDQLKTQVDQQLTTVMQDKVNYYQQLAQAFTQQAQGQTADPIAQAAIALKYLQGLYNKLKSAGVTDPTILAALRGQIGATQIQQTAAQISQFQAQAQTNLAQANIGQPQQVQLSNAVQSAQTQLSQLDQLKSQGKKINPVTLIQAQGALYSAQGALAQFQIEQGAEMIQAEASIKEAQTFDPVQIAEDALNGARQLLAYDKAHNLPAAQIAQQQATVLNDIKTAKQAKWQKEIAMTQYLADTYQITGAQEILRLKHILQIMKANHASYQDLLSIRKQIFDLEYGNNGGLNLNTGSIHLPSTYEVKSAIRGYLHGMRVRSAAGIVAQTQMNMPITIVVNKNADARKVFKEIDRALNTTTTAIGQAVGLA